jgi:uroporphyrin-III C-methyltransferase / precorrin-2 dehydrogenase / sirohydrochlorin ferrochelatase
MGKVYLAGAGPGHPELITIKLSRVLQEADVIITDRLVNPEIISTYAGKNAEVIAVGKEGYNDLSFSQDEINNLLLEKALQKNIVVRLKGGDVAFFSNVLDELHILHKNNIPFEIIPGITAASGASAYTGIPLTARGYSRSVRLMTYDEDYAFTTNEWVCLANSPDTLVLYMGIKKLPAFIRQLKKYSDESKKLVAIIEQTSTIFQQVHIFSLDDAALLLPDVYQTPALVIIGEVVGLHKKFNWYEAGKERGSVFKNLTIA